ncbi:MAG: hypothetical protein HOP23_01110 [Methylococcaceae bacterium]|nr:hypothetical protein [Methylococcaceae bacterium]
MDIFPLAIFPQGSLSSSIIPVVWVGLSVVCFFNLRLGWVLSGLVVPGYLVPLMLIKPWAATVVLGESFLTYFLVWLFSEYLSRWASWCNFFGRDRFFALILCSIVVRLLVDGWLLPIMGEWVNQHWHIAFDYHNQLHSFGLIIVALIANQFWKTGFLKGLIPLTVTLVLTLVIVRYGLMELTNFDLSTISYLYEDMASSLLATPKAYIILVSTAFLASRMNLHYGWDFNGILIPSLLALQWYQPIKILATLIESGIILTLATVVLKMPWFNKMTIEGARKLLMFFNISFVYKILLGHFILAFFPELKVTDYFGFGYLLSSLMAVKIHDRAILARLTRATLQTSLTAVLAASLIGFSLTQFPISKLFTDFQKVEPSSVNRLEPSEQTLWSLLDEERVELYQAKFNSYYSLPLAHELDFFSDALTLLQDYSKHPEANKLQQAADYLKKVNYTLNVVNGRYLYLHEKAPMRDWGVYVIDTQSTSTLSVEIPAPLDELGVFDAGVALFDGLGAECLAISGSSRVAGADFSSDVLQSNQTFFHIFHNLFNRHNILQVHLYSPETARQVKGIRRAENEIELPGLDSILWVKESLPESLNLVKLKELIDHYKVDWSEPPFANRQRQLSGYGFAELLLNQQDARKLLFKPLLLKPNIHKIEQDLRIDGYLQEWVLNRKLQIAPKGSQLYKKPKQEELLFLDEQVVSPLLKFVRQSSLSPNELTDDTDELKAIAQAANIVGYELITYKDLSTNQNYLILAEQDNKPLQHWGIYVLRLGGGSNYVVQIPRPLSEINSFEYGVSLFERLQAKILMIGTTHPYANSDFSSDLVNPENKINVFNLFSQVVLREAQNDEMMIVVSRAFRYRPNKPFPEADVFFATEQGLIDRNQLQGIALKLLDSIERDGMKVQLIDGSEQTMSYEVGTTAQSNYINATQNKHFGILWLSPNARAGYRQQNENQLQAAQFNSLSIRTIEQDLSTYILQHQELATHSSGIAELQSGITGYVDEQDVVRLQYILSIAKAGGYQLERLLDRRTKQAFLLIHDKDGALVAISNLLPRSKESVYLDKNAPLKAKISEFIDQRKAWLIAGID